MICLHLKENFSVNGLIQRFSEPGHRVVQEVDCIYSNIESWLKPIETFSILSLIRLLVSSEQEAKSM